MSAIAQEDNPNSQDASQHASNDRSTQVEAEVSKLIRQLASPLFSVREQSMVSLREIGEPALAQLRKVSPLHLESHRRAQLIVRRIEDEQFDRVSRVFLLDKDPRNSYGLPAWECYREIVGSSRTSKLLFLDMVREQPELARIIASVSRRPESLNDDRQADGAKTIELERLAIETARLSTRLSLSGWRREEPAIGDLIAVLLATSQIEGSAPVEINDLLQICAHRTPVTEYTQRSGFRNVIHGLYTLWIPKTHAAMAPDAMFISLRDGHSTGAIIARRNLAAHLSVRTREYSILCLARFGDSSDIIRLSPLLDDDTVCSEFRASQLPQSVRREIEESDESPPGAKRNKAEKGNAHEQQIEAQYQYRIRDGALAASMLLANENMQEVFPNFVADDRFAFDIRGVAVLNDKQRQEERLTQIEKWKKKIQSHIAKGQYDVQ